MLWPGEASVLSKRLSSAYSTQCCKGIWVCHKERVLPLEPFLKLSQVSAFLPWQVDHYCKCYQYSLTVESLLGRATTVVYNMLATMQSVA